MEKILSVDRINTYYGKSHILFDVSLDIYKNEVLCLLGRNGAGKTTTFKSIVMLNKPVSGKVIFNGKDLNGLKPYQIFRLGIGLVPEDRRIFGPLTVRENLMLGARVGRKGVWNLDMVYKYFPILKEYESKPGGMLSGGEQQMLTIARTLMGNPDVLLLDEPSEGLSPVMVNTLKEIVLGLKAAGATIILSEQHVKFAMAVSDRVSIIDKGHIVYESSIEKFKEDLEIQKKYLAV
ncbi:MAG: ABC transporter ATP-binding protein [Candidatus Omnitrophica bacterium]|nr:ABC transporter ATP-binding protein [Candidatus Omnitrophota bacterium]